LINNAGISFNRPFLKTQVEQLNAIAPGWITVENYHNALPGFDTVKAAEDAKRIVPVARYGVPLDVAKFAVYLCSDDAGFIVGQTILIDGGSTVLISLMPDFRNESAAQFGKAYVPGV
jgi:enoyl-[acyl-carrier-protein] reductase (NADH)